uniref:MYB family transcription factor n=1 Tax=Melilotus albus TaxID=47082 RepID=A0A896WF86_MELAB|nr:MYB family transcription factor [Melilotus albus]
MALFTHNPSFPVGLKVIAIDHDITHLNTIQDMCNRFHYHVTKCSTASDAVNLLERKECFDVMLIDDHMPNMDAYHFVQHATEQLNIPVIMMSFDPTESSVMKSISYGACAYWTKPLYEEQFKNISNEDDNGSNETNAKNARLSWSPKLHQRFLWAINQLGLDKAKPKLILKVMDVRDLTIGHVASHLQKYRNHLKRSADETKRGRKKSKLSVSFQADWIDQDRSRDFQAEQNYDFEAEWIDCGTGSYLHNLMV